MSQENTSQDLPDKGAMVKIPGMEVVVDSDHSWETVGMIVVLVLAIYGGIKIINYYFDRKKNSLW